jgi:hypothetical protein
MGRLHQKVSFSMADHQMSLFFPRAVTVFTAHACKSLGLRDESGLRLVLMALFSH